MKLACLPGALGAAASRSGWPEWAGAALLLVSVVVYATAVAPRLQRLEAVRERASVLRQVPPAPAAAAPAAGAPAEQLARFRGLFVAHGDALPLAAQVVNAAQRHGLVPRQAAYRFEEDKGLGLTRMHIALPLKGRYVAIRRFLADVRQEIPSLALEQVQFERRAAGDPQVEARIMLRLYLGAP